MQLDSDRVSWRQLAAIALVLVACTLVAKTNTETFNLPMAATRRKNPKVVGNNQNPATSEDIEVYDLSDLDSLLPPSATATSLPTTFVEEEYLQQYPDIAAAVESGLFKSGHEHYVLHGKAEGRYPNVRRLPFSSSALPKLSSGLSAAQQVIDCWTYNGSWLQDTTFSNSVRLIGTDPGSPNWMWVPSSDASPCASLLKTHPLPNNKSPEKLCQALSGARILIIGDSLAGQTYNAHYMLAMTLGDATSDVLHDWPKVNCTWSPEPTCHAHSFCNNTATVSLLRNDLLLLRTRARYSVGIDQGQPFGDLLTQVRPTHVIINRGAHYKEDRDYYSGLSDAVAVLRKLLPKSVIILRTTPHGHANCENFTEPLTHLPDDYPAYLSRLAYHWGRFPAQNALMRRLAAEQGLIVIDYAAPTSLRPDHLTPPERHDCLHYTQEAQGSPVHTWARLNVAVVDLLRRSKH